ncbi:chromosomal replication initiator protein DnaA [Desulfotomaculum arcticum]|uniref:Chromosomal replication initiator protein DnaA n=1 Tax=Desulfotruncus arcticus DSM 17038 TaxID=1121424 RepID=A0A1I2VMZ9_9FIRM|nr:chromosomal replication initiator protein DnaA [Desulfotruncus arcticus]SFG90522.1 chromosomal replication initiator protein DnaA [Desulfotomaculum arcticum] [Desulfotruncus arcticus DSM 17038]
MISADVTTIWGKTVKELKNHLNSQSYETWIKTMKPVSIRNNVFYIIVQDQFSRDWLNNSYAPLFKDIISKIDNSIMDVQFIMQDEIIQDNSAVKYRNTSYELRITPLNPKYTFDNFVVGDSNRFAHAACLAVADSPAKAYNPLFIYGGVGLGKTHLMHAIGHFISETNKLQVAYVTSEKFTNDLISAIREEKTVEFKEKYRSIDTLLIDDIQFLAGKERTQEEFFHTFNTLYEASKQIIISSDRPPKEIPTLEDRLRSRFEWGLITDIQPPDYETRIAILQKKANMENYNVQDDVITFIADRINSNIRELEGALIRVAAYSSLTNETIDKDTAQEVLKDILPDKKPVEITIPLIQQKVSNFFGLKIEDLKSKKRHRAVALPRQIAMYLCRELTDYSLPKVGDFFGGRDHTTVLHAQDKVSTEIQKDPTFAQTVHKLLETIKQG